MVGARSQLLGSRAFGRKLFASRSLKCVFPRLREADARRGASPRPRQRVFGQRPAMLVGRATRGFLFSDAARAAGEVEEAGAVDVDPSKAIFTNATRTL